MTRTPDYTFNKNSFAWAIDMAWDFKKELFDCVAGLKNVTAKDKTKFENLKSIISRIKASHKTNTEKDSAFLYLAQTVIYCAEHPESSQTKAFTELWKALYLLFPTEYRQTESFDAAFKSLAVLKDLFESTKAQYYILHAFARHNNFSQQSDYKRALTLVANNECATIVDLFAVLDVRIDMDEKIATAVIEKCKQKIEQLQKVPVELRDNRMSGNKTYNTRYAYMMKNICSYGRRASRMLSGLKAKYAIEMMAFFDKMLAQLAEESAENTKVEKVPNINDLSQYPNYAKLLQSVKESDKNR